MSVKYLIQREITIVSTCYVLPLLRCCPLPVHALLQYDMFTINVYPVIILCICQERERYKLGDPRTFHYLNQSNCIKLEGLDESKEYLETRKAMDIIGISSEEQVHI